jgi:hypothetical protein
MKRLLRAGCLALLSAAALAVEIDVGSTRLTVPAPDGYALVTDDMRPYADIAKRFVPPQNQQFALFLSPVDAALAAKGGAPEPQRFFYVQTLRDLAYRPVTTRDFAGLKRAMKAENDKIAGEIEAKAPGMIREINAGIEKDYDVDIALSVSQVVPLPPHHESDRSLALSMITKYGMTDVHGNPVSWEASITVTLVHLRAKILYLYAVGQKDDLSWTREASREWAAAFVAANPSTGTFAEQERGTGFDWVEVVKYGIIGAVVAGLISAFAAVAKSRRRARGG